MLYIKGATLDQQDSMENAILDPDRAFHVFRNEPWVDSEFSRKVITDIDKIDVMDSTISVKDILQRHKLSLDSLATGTKNVLVCRYYEDDGPDPIYNRLGRMGENCFKWLMQAATVRDIYIVTTVFRRFRDEDMQGASVCFVDTGKIVTTADSVCLGLLDLMGLHLLEGT